MIEVLCEAHNHWWAWAAFIGLVCVFLWLDLAVFHKKTHAVSIREAVIWAIIWFSVAMVFNVLVWVSCGAEMGIQFFTGYIIEKSLSVDNLFVILLVFTSFGISAKYQHRVLFWGILGALVMRGLLIGIGSALITRFDWIFYLFGAFLVWTGIKMFFETEEKFDHEKSVVVRFVKRFVPVVKGLRGDKFFVKQNGKTAVTVLFLALAVVEFTDVVFAFDSIPAIFAISTDPFIVFTSNVFAILGLRSLYFVIAKAHDLFAHLKTGLSVILAFIGIKLLLKDFWHPSIFLALGVVLGILIISIVASIMLAPKHHGKERLEEKNGKKKISAKKLASKKKKQ